MAVTKAVLPVAGLGTRLLPATKSQPKEMLPVASKPVVQYVVEELIEQGIDKFLFITGRKKRSIEDHFDDDPELEARLSGKGESNIGEMDYAALGVDFFYVRQRRAAGNADAVRMAKEFVGSDSFVVAFGDTIVHSDRDPGVVARMVASHEHNQSAATIGVWEVAPEDVVKYGIVQPEGGRDDGGAEFAIEDIIEKPAVEDAPTRLAVAARYVFTNSIFDAIAKIEPGLGGELWLTDAIRHQIKSQEKVRCVRLTEQEGRYDIGTPSTYYRAFVDFALADGEHGEALKQYLKQKLAE